MALIEKKSGMRLVDSFDLTNYAGMVSKCNSAVIQMITVYILIILFPNHHDEEIYYRFLFNFPLFV